MTDSLDAQTDTRTHIHTHGQARERERERDAHRVTGGGDAGLQPDQPDAYQFSGLSVVVVFVVVIIIVVLVLVRLLTYQLVSICQLPRRAGQGEKESPATGERWSVTLYALASVPL